MTAAKADSIHVLMSRVMHEIGAVSKGDLRWLRERCEIDPQSGCWVWQGATGGTGYGAVSINGRTETVHRLAAAAAYGPCPSGQEVLHSCDVRACCNPSHLRYGTRLENVRDAVARGRNSRPPRRTGEQHYKTTLTADDVRRMREARAGGATLRELASEFGTTKSTVSNICRFRTWADVA